ncbi:MsnO8 family LLM class oxidoreductase [Archangium violaceum]|uniref:MsnO8 family LLM class oxidoreductase n=1 Tax=Archangium violaceum TaxID=83451 RepID=UPI000698BF85|nr:MsnO8 family LLM class oxidoreductase [Archangium violaceum]
MHLGILDFCPIRKGHLPYESIHETIRLAQEADALGMSRFWLAEHHELAYAHHAPDIMAALLAGATDRIRIGVAGMLLKLHSPMRVAKAFRLMESLFPGRIDLGMAGGEAEPAVIDAMRDRSQPLPEMRAEYPQRVLRLVELIRGQSPLVFNPLGTPTPPLWMLGMSSLDTARLAAHQGMNFGFSLAHPQSRDNPSVTACYLEEFRPAPHQPQPGLVVAVTGLCAETEEEARRLAGAHAEHNREGLALIGNPAQCRERMEEICHRYRTQELVFLDLAPDAESRLRCYRLLASELRLSVPAPAPRVEKSA